MRAGGGWGEFRRPCLKFDAVGLEGGQEVRTEGAFSQLSAQKPQIKALEVEERSRDCSMDKEGLGDPREHCS